MSAEEALKEAKEEYGDNVTIFQDNDVLDTWFFPALLPFSSLGLPEKVILNSKFIK